jgi:hypothetical protein
VSEPASNVVHLVRADTGEAESVCPDCLTKDQEKTRLTRSYEGTIRSLKAELEAVRGDGIENAEVREVFEHWANTVVNCGFWTQQPKLTTGRSEPIQKRLSQGYTVDYLVTVVDSVRLSKPGIRQAWVDLPTLLSEPSKDGKRWGMEARYEDVVARTNGRKVRLPDAAWKLLADPALPYLCEECSCGHLRLDHSKPDPARDDADPCLVHGCYCDEFDESWVWHQGKLEQLRRRPAKCDICSEPVTAGQWEAHEASSTAGRFTHLACSLEWAERGRGRDGIVRLGAA